MGDLPRSHYSVESGESTSLPSSADSRQLALLSATHSADASSPTTGPESRSGLTCDGLLPTPMADCVTTRARRYAQGGLPPTMAYLTGDSPSSPAGSPVSLTALRESVARLVTSVISGPSAPGLQGSLDLPGASGRTSLDSSPPSPGDSSPASSVIWPRWGIAWRGESGALHLSALPIDVSGFSSSATIPTATAGDAASSGSKNTAQSKAHPGVSLTDYVRADGGKGRMWPTPNAGNENWTGSINEWGGSGSWVRKAMQDEAFKTAMTGSLNPEWVARLMGFPDGWLDVPPAPTSGRKPGRAGRGKKGSRE